MQQSLIRRKNPSLGDVPSVVHKVYSQKQGVAIEAEWRAVSVNSTEEYLFVST